MRLPREHDNLHASGLTDVLRTITDPVGVQPRGKSTSDGINEESRPNPTCAVALSEPGLILFIVR